MSSELPVPTDPDVAELDLRHYVRVLGRRRLVIAATAAAVVAVALVHALLQDPSYRARARVLVAHTHEQSLFDRRVPVVDPNRVVQTEVLAFDSPAIREEVRSRIGRAPAIVAHQVEQTDVVEIVADDPNAEEAARVANAYAAAYVELRRRQSLDHVVTAAEQLQEKISELQRQIEAAGGEQQNALIDQQALFRQRLDQLQIDTTLQEGGARVISEATVPRSPESPAPVRSALVALAFGLLLGVGLALGLEYLDDSIRSQDDVERVVPDVGVVGLIPLVPRATAAGARPLLVSVDDPASPAAEAFRTLRTSLAFLSLQHQIGVVQVTSPNPGEGKSSITANLGVTVARAGRRVVAIDCDLRRPRLHDYFGCDGSVGLMSVLAGDATLADAVVPVPGVPRLSVLPAGPIPASPAEILVASRMADVIAALHREGAIVLLDSPPVLPVTDALLISARADATVLVAMAARSTRKQLRRAVELLRHVKAPLVGLVVNAVEPGEAYGTAYRYPLAAGEPAESASRRPRASRQRARA